MNSSKQCTPWKLSLVTSRVKECHKFQTPVNFKMPQILICCECDGLLIFLSYFFLQFSYIYASFFLIFEVVVFSFFFSQLCRTAYVHFTCEYRVDKSLVTSRLHIVGNCQFSVYLSLDWTRRLRFLGPSVWKKVSNTNR